MPVLDATFLIAMEREPDRQRPFLQQLIDDGEALLVPVQAAIEVAAGAPDAAETVRRIMESFAIVPVGPSIAVEAGRLARAAFAAGTFPGWPDIQVAATARHEGMAVVTRNAKHFEPLGVRVAEHP